MSKIRYCDKCGLPMGFEPVWRNGRLFRWKAVNPDGTDHLHSYEQNEVPWQ